jgi:Na+/H+-dicarboxylate symporter
VNYLRLFIPGNPFNSFANNIVPAVVLFSIALGLALIGIEEKHGLLSHLRVLNRAMARVTQFVSKLMPIGVFAVVASAAGTMGLEDLGRLQVYLLTYCAMALLLTLWFMPAMITSLTPLTYRQVVGQTRDILITAFSTGSAFIVLPLLIERSKELLQQAALSTAETEATVDVMVPAFTSFPKIGTLLPMSFVLFAGWFVGSTVPVSQYPTFVLTGVVSFFGSVNVAMPMLMDLLRIPVDLFQLYLAINVVTSRFAVLMSTMNVVVLTTVGTCAVTGFLTPRWGRILRNGLLTLVLTIVTIGAARFFFTVALENPYRKDEIIANMQLMRQAGHATVYTSLPSLPSDGRTQLSAFERIRTRGTLRVGYLPDNLPFAFVNTAGDLVGFDIEMAHILARELGVDLAFVPIEREQMAERLEAGYCDLIMSGIAVTPRRAQRMAFTQPYLSQTAAFLVKDHRRDAFNSRDAVQRLGSLRIGVLNVPYYMDKLQRYLPQAEMVVLKSVTEFLERRGDDLDAFLYTAEAGSAWSLLYPAYTVAIPQPDVLTGPLAYATARDNPQLLDFMNVWIELKQQDRTIASLYDYWILGKNAVPKAPRWSVIRNVLHWVE